MVSNMSLSYKILISVIVPILLLSLFIFVGTSAVSNDYLFETFKEKHLNELTLVEEKMNKRLNEIADMMSVIVEITQLTKQNISSSKEILKTFIKRLPEIEQISIIDIMGKELLCVDKVRVGHIKKNLKQVSDLKLFKYPLANKKRFIGDFTPDGEYVSPVIDISIPIMDKNKNVIGVLWAVLAVSNFYNMMEHYIPDEGAFFLADMDAKELIVRLKRPQNLTVNYIRIINLLEQIGRQKGAFSTGIAEIPYTVIYKIMNFNGTNLGLILLESDKTLYAFQHSLMNRHLSIILPGLFFIIIFIVWRIKQLIKPLIKLIKDVDILTNKYAVGNLDSISIDSGSEKDEVQLLNRAFLLLKKQVDRFSNEIVNINKTLGHYVEKTEGKNQNLEKMVDSKVKEIQYQVYHDALTGLPNRRLFNDRLEMAIAYSARSKKSLAIIFLDLDDFKNINDTMGHHIGDIFLKEVAKRVKNCCREEDTVSRFGGDEFVIILPDAVTIEDAKEVADRILLVLAEPLTIDNTDLVASTSIGITQYPADGKDVNTLLKNADMAMYSAKKSGKNKYSVFTQEMNEGIIKRIALENSLRKALERDEFKILYQPKVDLTTGFISGTEALVRWQKDEETLVSPSEFIFVAEESDIICLLGEWVLRKACEDTMKIHKYGFPELSVAVNISARQFQDPGFIQLAKKVLGETGLDPKYLNIEITENIVMNDVDCAIETMKKLNNLNVKISIDDFGTGYSSLSYLKRFPVHTLKIDRSFIKDIPENMEDVAIAKSIMSLAHSLYLTVVAEGVENWEHLKFLKEHGCDEIQGNFCSMPITAPEILQMLRKGAVLV